MPAPLRIAAVYAHPDDGEFFAAGSLIKWARQGHQIYAICATNGDLGTKRPDVDGVELGLQRAAELGRAMETIGGEPPICLGLPDAMVRENAQLLKERLVYHFRRLKIDRVLTFDPWKRYEIHPDHIEVGRMATEAACFSCFPLLYPEHRSEGIEAHQPSEVWFMMPTEHRPNRVVDIRDTFDDKVRSLLCHSSQIEMLADWFVPGADPANLTAEQRSALESGARMFLEGMARALAVLVPRIELAEAFFAQTVGPGHLQNYQEMFMEMAGAPPAQPELL
jgi:LmbE family N-acetylglucosaminyl deacetylase